MNNDRAVASRKTRRLHGLLFRGIKSSARLVILRPKLYYFTDAKMITARNTDHVRKYFIILCIPNLNPEKTRCLKSLKKIFAAGLGAYGLFCDGTAVRSSEYGFGGHVQGSGDIRYPDRVLDIADHVAVDDQIPVEPFLEIFRTKNSSSSRRSS